MSDTTFRVVLTGGGSGGHIYPLLAVAEALRARAEKMSFDLSLSYLGPNDSNAVLVQNAGISVHSIVARERYAATCRSRTLWTYRNFLSVFFKHLRNCT